MSTFQKSFDALEKVLEGLDNVPFCDATFPWDSTKTLFYKSGEVGSRFLKFPATNSQFESLLSSCEPAEGPTQTDVSEESFRKAGIMEAGNFAMPFSPYDEGILGMVAETLLRGRFDANDIKVKLDKLHVYAPGGFSKAHVDTDTPCDASMFGSLIVILPTVHEGGSFSLRSSEREWNFNSAEAVRTTPSAQAAFIASKTDVEYEVKTVSSGFLVTLTYSLYHSKPALISNEVKNNLEIKEALVRLLEDPTAFPEGGFIAFSLSHKYPLDVDMDESRIIEVSGIKECLKGSDATIKRACDLLSLPVDIKAAYHEDINGVLLDKIVNIEYQMFDALSYHLASVYDGEEVSYYTDDWELDNLPIVWVGPQAHTNDFKSTYLTDHHKWPLAYADGEVCMIATVPRTEERDLNQFLGEG